MEQMQGYTIKHSAADPEMRGDWDGRAWCLAETLHIDRFRPESSAHRPRVQARFLWTDEGICGLYDVRDKYVRCVASRFQDPVCRDSCVEFFVRPRSDKGYFNFEFSGNGTLLASYITDNTRTPQGFRACTMLPPEDGERVRVYHTLPRRVEPEIAEDTHWRLEFRVPFDLLARYVGPLGDVAGQTWHANFYKCGDKTSHPHWASWAPVSRLNFHLPECFAPVVFEP